MLLKTSIVIFISVTGSLVVFHSWSRGYMAPEYLIRGQLTDKADVYSFGVLVLEIVCGRRNNVLREDSGSLLQTVRPVPNLHNNTWYETNLISNCFLSYWFQHLMLVNTNVENWLFGTRFGNFTGQTHWLKLLILAWEMIFLQLKHQGCFILDCFAHKLLLH